MKDYLPCMKTGISVLGIRLLGDSGGELVLLDTAKGRTGVVKFTELNWFEEFVGPAGLEDDLPAAPAAPTLSILDQRDPRFIAATLAGIDPFLATVRTAIGVKQ